VLPKVLQTFGYALVGLLAVGAGIGLPLQAAVNVQLRQAIGSPVRASLASFVVGTALLLALSVASRESWPAAATLARTPWWIWTGGLLGAFFIFSTIVVVPRLGAAFAFALIVAGQMTASIAIDQFGLFGVQPTPASPGRLAGAALLVCAVVLIRK
jgi:transporter family-2 protein